MREKIMNTNVNLAGIKMKNPVTVASGTFGYGREFTDFIDLNKLGAIITKGTSLKPRSGNKPPRVCETSSGMLNSIGLQNPGLEFFMQYDLPWLKKYDTAIIVNAIGNTIEEYVELCKVLNTLDIDGVELNLSCPNVKKGCLAFGTTYEGVKTVTQEVRKVLTSKPLIVKLTPNVTDITQPAKGAQEGGADGVSLINTLLAMSIDIHKKKPILANNTGGLSGPAIKPVAVRMVYQVAQAVNIPILGMGGIMTKEDAIEFILAGATAISIGAGNLVKPNISMEIIKGIEEYMNLYNIKDINEITGAVTMN
ncbi:MAG: dihydroorotate dehydrogenase [Clostridia bacterium]|nr:dihydroorotate dehydrogenase [Clostridia bacterium]